MTELRAFVGHSFAEHDKVLVEKFLRFFDEVKRLRPSFTWENAEIAEPCEVAVKVLRILSDKNLFIGICTRKERVIADERLKPVRFRRGMRQAQEREFQWKTSDWAIQEIGLAMGRGLPIILLIEKGVRSAGDLQGNLEYIQFDRESPEKAFPQITQMIANQLPKIQSLQITASNPIASAPEPKAEAIEDQEMGFPTPQPSWSRRDYQLALMHVIALEDIDGESQINESYLQTEDGRSGE